MCRRILGFLKAPNESAGAACIDFIQMSLYDVTCQHLIFIVIPSMSQYVLHLIGTSGLSQHVVHHLLQNETQQTPNRHQRTTMWVQCNMHPRIRQHTAAPFCEPALSGVCPWWLPALHLQLLLRELGPQLLPGTGCGLGSAARPRPHWRAPCGAAPRFAPAV